MDGFEASESPVLQIKAGAEPTAIVDTPTHLSGKAIRNRERETSRPPSVIIAISALTDQVSQKRGRDEYVVFTFEVKVD